MLQPANFASTMCAVAAGPTESQSLPAHFEEACKSALHCEDPKAGKKAKKEKGESDATSSAASTAQSEQSVASAQPQ
jgi:hypothetical protein